MSAVDEQRQTAAIRAALGTTDAEVTRAPGGGWLVRVSDERAKLALDLYDRLGDSATADTFVTRSEDSVIDEADDETLSYAAPTARSSAASGNAADRERYVTERAEQIARAFHAAYERLAPGLGYVTRQVTAKPWADVPEKNRALMVATARDLIDRGVLK